MGSSHERYRKDGVQLAYGLAEDGKLRHIDEVPGGGACGCTCPACGSALIARHGKETKWHFAHYTNKECVGGPETALHLLAKEVLEEHRRVWLPAVVAEVQGRRKAIHPAQEMTFETVVSEKRLEGLTPDIILTRKGRDLVVEVAVTHACEPEKLRRLQEQQLPGIEIDLKKISREASRREVADAVIATAPRFWLWNSKIEAGDQELRAEIMAEANEKQQTLERQAAAYLKTYDAVLATGFVDHTNLQETIDRVAELGYRPVTSLPVTEERVFRVEPNAWQSMIFDHFIIHRSPALASYADVSVSDALSYLERCKIARPAFRTAPTHVVQEQLKALRPAFVTPSGVVKEYFDQLVARGFLIPVRGDYNVTSDTRQKVKERQNRLEAIASRTKMLEDQLKGIVNVDADFDAKVWCQTTHEPLRRSR